MLAEGHEEIQAYEAQSQKSLQRWGRPRIPKPSFPIPEKIPMGLNCSPQHFQQREKDNQWAGCHSGKHHSNPQLTPLDRNNSAWSRQPPQQPRGDQQWESDAGQSGYYSEDSDFDLVSMTSVTTSKASVTRKRQTEGIFNRHINQKITLPKLNDDSSTNDQWIWLADVRRYINSGCFMDILESKINKSLSNGSSGGGVWFCQSQMLGDTVEQALNKMRQTDQHQHSNGLLQEFYAMTKRHNEPIGKYAVRLNLAAGKVRLQSMEALGSTEEEREEDC